MSNNTDGTERLLARLYTDGEFRERFIANPAATLASLGLSVEQCERWQTFDAVGLRLAARSYQHKRSGRVRRKSWVTRMFRWMRSVNLTPSKEL